MNALLAIRKCTIERFHLNSYYSDMATAMDIARLIESRVEEDLVDEISIAMPANGDVVNLLRAAGYHACLIASTSHWDYAIEDSGLVEADNSAEYDGGICVSLFKVN